jgi:hypothetical protein
MSKNKIIYRIIADFIWFIHLMIVIIVVFGGFFPKIFYVYVGILIVTLLSEIIWKYCILSKWEFDLRKKINPKINYEYEYASYYTYKLTHGKLSKYFLGQIGIYFVSISLVLAFYFKFFY